MQAQNREFIASSLINYSQYIFEATRGSQFIYNWHHGLICDHLERVLCGLTKRLIINIPPRFSKTQLAVIDFTAWALGHYPDSEFIHASYAATLASNNSYQIRNIIQHEAYREVFPELQLAGDSKARHWWRTSQGGAFYAAGAGGSITGFGSGKAGRGGLNDFAGAVILDDLQKPQEAKRSAVKRQSIIDWFKGTIESRLNDQNTPIIIIMQRLHAQDIAGWLLDGGNGEEWEHVVIPAILPNGEALWPEKMSIEELNRIKISKPYEFSGQYMQTPTPEGGGMFKTEWFNRRYRIAPNLLFIMQSWDTAQKDNLQRNDPSVCTTWGIAQDGYYLLDVYKKHLEYPELLQKMKDLAARFKPNVVLVEDKSSGTSAIQELKRSTLLPVIGIEPKGSKIDRAESVTGYYESGRVILPESAPWIAEFIAEHELFPFGSHDDQVDSVSQFLTYVNRQQGRGYAAL